MYLRRRIYVTSYLLLTGEMFPGIEQGIQYQTLGDLYVEVIT